MAIQIQKNKPVSLAKETPGLQGFVAGLGWDPAVVNGHSVDLDLSLFMLGADGKLIADEFLVFYNNTESPDGASFYPGDSRGGVGEGDDEIIKVDITKIDPKVEFLYFTVTIDESEERGHHFGHVKNSYINIRNAADNTIICQYKLDENFTNEDSLVFAAVSRNNGNWDVEAMGQAFSGGLGALVELYQ